ncbi:MAG TPA: hypothetical protein VF786_04395 [Terriglobales bacterium]
MGAVQDAFGKQRSSLQGTDHFLGVLDTLGRSGELLGIEVEDRSRAQGEEDGTDEGGNDDQDSIA